MNKNELEQNIRLYTWHMALNNPIFWGPVMIRYLQEVGHMTLSQVYYLEAACLIILAVMQVVSGTISDLIGRKRTVVIGTAILVLSWTMFALIQQPLHVLVANIVWAVGFSLVSGADEAFMYDALKEHNREHEFAQIQGRAHGAMLLLLAAASPIAGWAMKAHSRLPMILSIPVVVIALLLATRWIEPRFESKGVNPKEQWRLVRQSGEVIRENVALVWIIGFYIVVSASTQLWFFSYNPYFKLAHVPLEYYGYIFTAMNLIAWGCAHFQHLLVDRMGEKATAIFLFVILIIPLLIMGIWVTQWAAWLVCFPSVVRGIYRPFVSAMFNHHIESEYRTTANSVRSSIQCVAMILALGLYAIIAHSCTVPQGFIVLAGCTLLGAIVLMWWHIKKMSK